MTITGDFYAMPSSGTITLGYLPGGVYVARLRAGKHIATRKLTVTR
jgi:hypothetical protein